MSETSTSPQIPDFSAKEIKVRCWRWFPFHKKMYMPTTNGLLHLGLIPTFSFRPHAVMWAEMQWEIDRLRMVEAEYDKIIDAEPVVHSVRVWRPEYVRR